MKKQKKFKILAASDFHGDSSAAKVPLTEELISQTAYVDEQAVPGVNYYYSVKAFATTTGARESEFSLSAQGSRPVPPVEMPHNVSASDRHPGYVWIQWTSVPFAEFYQVYRSVSETDAKVLIADWQAELNFVDVPPMPEAKYFYWIVASASPVGSRQSAFGGPDVGQYFSNVDIDGDGIVDGSDNCLEVANPDQANNDGDLFGDVCDPDDDNDGMSDEYESKYALNPFDAADAGMDDDADGLTNLEESNLGTAANNADSDNDGLDDNVELDMGRSPVVNEASLIQIINDLIIDD